jgi:RNAse (barnase) inhibitor barstar
MRVIILIMLLSLSLVMFGDENVLPTSNEERIQKRIFLLNEVPKYLTENRLTFNEDFKKNLLQLIDESIIQGKELQYETEEGTIYEPIISVFRGDARILEIYYRLILFGDNFAIRTALDGITSWWDVPNDNDHLWLSDDEYVVSKVDSEYISNLKDMFIDEIQKLLNHKSAAIQVSSAICLVKLGFTNECVLNVLEKYSNSENSSTWDLTDTVIYRTVSLKFYSKQEKNENDRRIDSINEILKKANEGLKLYNQSIRKFNKGNLINSDLNQNS